MRVWEWKWDEICRSSSETLDESSWSVVRQVLCWWYHVIIDTDISCSLSPDWTRSSCRITETSLVVLSPLWVIIQENSGNRKIQRVLGNYFSIKLEFNWVNKLIINYFNPHHDHYRYHILLFLKGQSGAAGLTKIRYKTSRILPPASDGDLVNNLR